MSNYMRHVLAAITGSAMLMLGMALGGTTALADYGQGAVKQVEISANPPGFGFWLWAELSSDQTGDYQETDCIHLGGGHENDAAAHDSGSVTGWSVSNGVLTMTGIKIIGGLAAATFSVPVGPSGFGHANSMTMTVTQEVAPFFPVGVPLTFPAQVQVAP
jgi:hypothetical protein